MLITTVTTTNQPSTRTAACPAPDPEPNGGTEPSPQELGFGLAGAAVGTLGLLVATGAGPMVSGLAGGVAGAVTMGMVGAGIALKNDASDTTVKVAAAGLGILGGVVGVCVMGSLGPYGPPTALGGIAKLMFSVVYGGGAGALAAMALLDRLKDR